jgi:hypothetical protein
MRTLVMVMAMMVCSVVGRAAVTITSTAAGKMPALQNEGTAEVTIPHTSDSLGEYAKELLSTLAEDDVAVRAENDDLKGEVDRLKAENAQLRVVVMKVAGRVTTADYTRAASVLLYIHDDLVTLTNLMDFTSLARTAETTNTTTAASVTTASVTTASGTLALPGRRQE